MKCPMIDWGKSEGFVWAKILDATYFSSYFSPNIETGIFHHDLDVLEDTIRSTQGEIIVGGDFNAKSQQWGMNWSETRGNPIADMVARCDLTVLNTFRLSGNRGTIIDISFATSGIALQIQGWHFT